MLGGLKPPSPPAPPPLCMICKIEAFQYETTKLSAAFIVKETETSLIRSIVQSHSLQVHSGHLLFKFLENINKRENNLHTKYLFNFFLKDENSRKCPLL